MPAALLRAMRNRREHVPPAESQAAIPESAKECRLVLSRRGMMAGLSPRMKMTRARQSCYRAAAGQAHRPALSLFTEAYARRQIRMKMGACPRAIVAAITAAKSSAPRRRRAAGIGTKRYA